MAHTKIHTIGDRDQVDLVVRKNVDIVFDLEWYDEDGVTPIPIASVRSAEITDERTLAQVKDLAAYCNVLAAPVDHTISVSVPHDQANLIPRGRSLEWAIVATSAAGEDKELAGGVVRCKS